jgi:UDP:flavonoid glycosyltransferase YjiC (YdhE family)
MHAVLITVGTDGDIFPYVGLGAELRSRGHRVTLAASGQYADLAQAQGLEFCAIVSAAENDELFTHPDFWKPTKTARLSAQWGLRFLRRQYQLLADLAGPDAVLVANPGVLAASLVQETRGTPWTNLILQPWMIPSCVAPPRMPHFGFLAGAPRVVWKLFWRGLDLVVDLLMGRELNLLRTSLGLRPTRRIFRNWLSKELVIGMFPDWYGPPQTDWPRTVRLTGFPLFSGGTNLPLPPAVGQFLAEGRPPIAFTFGTGMAHSAALFRTARETCDKLGARGIFLTRFREQLPPALPPGILPCAFAPFEKLFPSCAAVVHHGGIGTVAQALASGTPQLIHPLCFDQIDNGHRVERLGGGSYLRSARISGEQMAAALSPLLTPEIRRACGELASRFGPPDSFRRAAQLVESLAKTSRGQSTGDLARPQLTAPIPGRTDAIDA